MNEKKHIKYQPSFFALPNNFHHNSFWSFCWCEKNVHFINYLLQLQLQQQPICNSLKVKNCLNLSKSYSRDEILADSVCKVQCSFALRILPQFERKPLSNDANFGLNNNGNFGNNSPPSGRSISFGFSNTS